MEARQALWENLAQLGEARVCVGTKLAASCAHKSAIRWSTGKLLLTSIVSVLAL